MDLNDYRKEIDSIDDQLIALFAQRMETAEKIAEYKKANGLRVLDARREKEKMREILDKTPDDLREYVSSLYSLIFELSRSRQSCLLGTKGDLPAKIAEAIRKDAAALSRGRRRRLSGRGGRVFRAGVRAAVQAPEHVLFQFLRGGVLRH